MKNTLKNKKDIDKLFSFPTKGKVVGDVLIKTVDGTPGFLFTVSAKKFKRAVDRNRIKRLMREEVKGMTVTNSVALIYVGKDVPTKLNFRKYLSDSNI
jgi:ribonuclease P protein component